MFNDSLLTVENITYIRNHHALFSHLSFSLNKGEILQINGINGAGKTSLLRILVGLQNPHAGDILWKGQSIQEDISYYQNQLIYLGHRLALKNDLTVIENLNRFKPIMTHYHSVLEHLNLQEFEQTVVKHLSAGQRQRVALARVALSQSQLWILDEPFTALDKEGLSAFHFFLEKHRQEGGVSIIATHHALDDNAFPIKKVLL